MPLRWVRGVALVFVVALFAMPAQGRAKRDEGKKAFEQGRRAYNLGHWSDALAAFEKAYETSGDSAILFNLAETHRQLGHTGDALRLYREYLSELPSGPDHEAAAAQVASLSGPPPAKSPPPVTTPPPMAGPARPAPPPPVRTAPAPAPPHPIASPPPLASLKAPGASRAAPPPPAPPPPAAAAPPPRPAAVAPLPAAPPPAVGPPTLLTQAPPAVRPHRSKWPVIAGAAATGVFAAGAVAFTVSGNSLYNDLKGSCGNTATGCTSGQIDSLKTRDRAATALWILTGVAAVATSVVLVVRF